VHIYYVKHIIRIPIGFVVYLLVPFHTGTGRSNTRYTSPHRGLVTSPGFGVHVLDAQ